MRLVNVHEAKSQLSRLIRASLAGEDVVIARAGEPLVRLVPVTRSRRRPGGWEGKVWIADDFDDLPGDVAADFRGEQD